jgi:hypothetical protein
MSRKTTPDVLGNLLGEDEETTKSQDDMTANQQTSKTVNRQDSKPSKQQAGKPSKQFSAMLASEEKKKSTLYFAPETVYALDEAKLQLRRMLEPDNLKAISKSSIAEAALLLALQDLAKKGEDSAIARLLAKQ